MNQSFIDEIITDVFESYPKEIPDFKSINNAPNRKDVLSLNEKELAIKNALRYFPAKYHADLRPEFENELKTFGHIYMYRFRPKNPITAMSFDDYPAKSTKAKAIMLMIANNLDNDVAQHPNELITYGGNGSVFQNWIQFRISMKYLLKMTDHQTLVLYSGHPLGLFPSGPRAPRVIVTNGMVIPNYSSKEEFEKYYALGVSQYGQMTAGSFMYIGPQGIVHGTTLTILNAVRKITGKSTSTLKGKVFVSSGLGGMSGAQAKASVICDGIAVIAEINIEVIKKRHQQGWVSEYTDNLEELFKKILSAKEKEKSISFAYHGNIVDLWEFFLDKKFKVDIGSDQTSLHNPFSGGYYPQGLSLEESLQLLTNDPREFENKVKESLVKHVEFINGMVDLGMYFFDYGNAFLLEAKRANADINAGEKNTEIHDLSTKHQFKYRSYIQDIIGPLCFDYGFGPFRWICTSNTQKDLDLTDQLALEVLNSYLAEAEEKIKGQIMDNILWMTKAKDNNLVVGVKSRILYADSTLRIRIALKMNQYIFEGKISAPIVLGRDHHDVSGTDSPYRETSNIYDGSQFLADMSVHTFVGNSFRGATWVSLHNGGGVGLGEVMNGGFGLVIDGTHESSENIKSMLDWDVNNGISRRAWAKNENALWAIKKAMRENPNLEVTLPYNEY